jgi:hypothetical protein
VFKLNMAALRIKAGCNVLLTANPANAANNNRASTTTSGRNSRISSVSSVSTLAGCEDSKPDPDRWVWPHSTAMTTREIATLTARLARFTDKGLSLAAAEVVADRLTVRDHDFDDRVLCLECTHLGGHRPQAWRCSAWQSAGLAIRPSDAGVSQALAHQLQRCDGFKAAT